jgi:hypothetical protein
VELTRRLIRHLAQSYTEHVLDYLLAHISFHGIMDTINKANQEKLASMEWGWLLHLSFISFLFSSHCAENPSQLPLKPQENKLANSPIKSSKDSLLTTTVRYEWRHGVDDVCFLLCFRFSVFAN